MSPELTGFALGLLLGAAKVMAIVAVGFGVAWWRARARIRSLEAELLESGDRRSGDEDWRHIGERLAMIAHQLQQLTATQALLAERLLSSPLNPSPDDAGSRPPGSPSP